MHRDRTQEEKTITAIRKTLTATAVVGAVLMGSAACGTVEQLSAGRKLDRAFEKLGKEKTISFELDLDVDAKTLKELDAESDPEPGEELPDAAAELISGAKVSVTMESKKPFDESEDKDLVGMAMKVSAPEGDLVEYRVIGDHTYLRLNAEALTKAMDVPVPPAGELPPEAKGLKKVLEGQWVTYNTKEMEKAGQEKGRAPGAKPSPEPSLDARTQKKLAEALRGAIARKVDFKTAGGEGGTDRITATAPFRSLITELVGEIRPLAKDLPPGMDLPTDEELKEVPDTTVTADFTLKKGELTEVRVDLAKLTEKAKDRKFGLVLKMTEGTSPTAPAGATELDPDELLGGFAGGMMQDGGPDESAFPGADLDEELDPTEEAA
ncbi:hypothetical protein [Streptomyces sp. NPDC089799]|uniref:hypothetical protein n=1 Tax=Streptomyces sp. NPDC089799 TaxID=3155066 RepID=UPI0034442CF1